MTHVETQADFVTALDKGRFASFDGISALAVARERTPDVPFILVSGVMGEERAINPLDTNIIYYGKVFA